MSADKVGFVLTLARLLSEHGKKPHVWSKDPSARQARLLAEPKSPSGLTEEAFILSQKFPTWVCDSPTNAAIAATHAGATVLLLCERSERCDQLSCASIALVEKNVGNKVHTLDMLAKSDIIVSISNENISELKHVYRHVFSATWTISEPKGSSISIFGFTGLHDSGAFYHCLLACGYNVKGFVPLSHVQHQEKQIQTMLKIAHSSKSILVTTDKDMPFLSKKMKSQIQILSFDLEFDAALYCLIEQLVFSSDASSTKKKERAAC
jgi:tetraacyldisaccharide-1-P 4'-kinase